MIFFYFTLFSVFVLLVAVLDRKFLLLHQLNQYSGGRWLQLGTLLFVRAIILIVVLSVFFVSLFFSVNYPMILRISTDIAFGEIYAISVFGFNFGYLFISIINNGLIGYRQVLDFWLRRFERMWLAGLPEDVRENYTRHGSWRWGVINRKFRIWLNSRKSFSVHFLRVMVLLIAGVATTFFALVLIEGLLQWDSRKGLFSLEQLIKAPQALTGVFFILGIPIAFAIWFFRDQNNLWQLENSRKDINLKDFQKLAEWAAGLHLPEDKITKIVKFTSSSKSNASGEKGESTASEESADSNESSGPPASGVVKTYSRRDGAVALQISSIYQMQAFLRGDFGSHFQRPAFQLLKSVWMALTQRHIEDISKIGGSSRAEYRQNVKKWRKEIIELTSKGVGSALTLALSGGNGQILRAHAMDLPHISLAGWQSMLPGRSFIENNVVFDGLDFQSAHLQGVNLKQAYLSRINLSSAQLFGANLGLTHLQGADLRWVDARFSTFNGARMQGAVLDGGIFLGADLVAVDLRGASMDGTRLQSAHLIGARLEGARLLNVGYDDNTDFQSASVDASTIVAVAALKSGLHNSAEQKFPDDFVVDKEETILLRSALAKRGLILP